MDDIIPPPDDAIPSYVPPPDDDDIPPPPVDTDADLPPPPELDDSDIPMPLPSSSSNSILRPALTRNQSSDMDDPLLAALIRNSMGMYRMVAMCAFDYLQYWLC